MISTTNKAAFVMVVVAIGLVGGFAAGSFFGVIGLLYAVFFSNPTVPPDPHDKSRLN